MIRLLKNMNRITLQCKYCEKNADVIISYKFINDVIIYFAGITKQTLLYNQA